MANDETDRVEAEWIEVTTIGSSWDEEMDLRAAPGSSSLLKYRHRPRSFTGQAQRSWSPGPAPKT